MARRRIHDQVAADASGEASGAGVPRGVSGYAAEGRVGSSGRRPIGIVLAGVVVAAVVGLGVWGRGLPSPSPGPAGPTPVSTYDGRIARATARPGVQRFVARDLARWMPVYSVGLRFLDLEQGDIDGVSGAARSAAPPLGALFVTTDRTICVCRDVPWVDGGSLEHLTVAEFSNNGHPLGRATAPELDLVSTSAGAEAIQRDVAMSGDGSIIVAHVTRDAGGWAVGVDRVTIFEPPTSGEGRFLLSGPRRIELGRYPEDPAGTIVLEPVLRVSPGGTVRVTVRSRSLDADAAATWTERAWILSSATWVDPAGWFGPVALTTVATTAPDRCDGEGWATERVYVRVCRRAAGTVVAPDGLDRPVVEVERQDPTRTSSARTIELPDRLVSSDLHWLLEPIEGVVYVWSPIAHLMTRLDVETDAMARVGFDPASPPAFGSLPDEPFGAHPGATGVASLFGDGPIVSRRLVPSRDGRRLYALGIRRVTASDGSQHEVSTGIWVFAARDLALLGHWGPDQADAQLGISPDGTLVFTISYSGIDAHGDPGPPGQSVAIYDAIDGTLIERIGDATDREGNTPLLLIPSG